MMGQSVKVLQILHSPANHLQILRVKGLTVTLKPGTKEVKQIPDCSIKFLDECFKIEKVDYPTASSVTAAIGAGGDKCTCGGKKDKKCKKCGCRVCGGHEDENNQV